MEGPCAVCALEKDVNSLGQLWDEFTSSPHQILSSNWTTIQEWIWFAYVICLSDCGFIALLLVLLRLLSFWCCCSKYLLRHRCWYPTIVSDANGRFPLAQYHDRLTIFMRNCYDLLFAHGSCGAIELFTCYNESHVLSTAILIRQCAYTATRQQHNKTETIKIVALSLLFRRKH